VTHDHSTHLHGHHHGPAPAAGGSSRVFAIGVGLNLAYVAAEIGFGVAAGSLALLADAAHNFGDVLGLGLAWGAALLSQRQPSLRFTYGLRSSSILAALANTIILLVVTGGILSQAVQRLFAPFAVEGRIVVAIALAGILVNGTTALLFARGRRGDLNIRSAFTHMMADALVSVGVVATGIVIALTGWAWLDAAASLVISAVIIAAGWGVMRSALGLALDAVPEGVDAAAVRAHLISLPGVAAIHDLHIWGMSTTETALTCHLVMPGGHPGDAALGEIAHALCEHFGIAHSTIQIELADSDAVCVLTPESVV
jgi:cobalt-zinc-cadmium efflux system protein